MNGELVLPYGCHALEALLLLEERGLQVDEPRFEHRFYLGLGFVELLDALAVHRDVYADVEDALLRLLERIAQLFEIAVRGIEHRIAHQTLFFTSADLAADFRDLFLEFAEDRGGLYRVYEDGDIKHLVEIDERREPSFGEEARIGDNEERARDLVPEVQFPRGDLERGRSDDVLELKHPGFINRFRQDRRERRGTFFFLE